jgi:hypothetical protein
MSSGHDGVFLFWDESQIPITQEEEDGQSRDLRENVMGVKRDLGLGRSRTEFSKEDWCLGLVLSLTKPASASLQ